MKIALCGIAGSGKDYFADFIMQKYDYQRLAFANALKETCAEIYPFLKKDYPAFEKEQPLNLEINGNLITKSPREIWLKTSETLREVDPLYFHNKSVYKIEQFMNETNNILITDLRMKIEFDSLIDLGFTIIYIEPKQKLYQPNEFDKQINEFVNYIPYKFTNNFNGTDEFEDYLKTNNLVL